MSAETTPADVVELVAKTIHDHWQGAPGLSARPWDGEKGTCVKLPAQAEDFRCKARAVIEALTTHPVEPAVMVVDDKPPVDWLWWGRDTEGVEHTSFGRWQSHGCQHRYKLAAVQPTEHDHPQRSDS